jgi:ubiquitin-associated SH3 domain-containing protein
MSEFIVYACPLGELADQLTTYFEKSQVQYGPNSAHNYMPHCTLTGFFTEQTSSIPLYVQFLDRAYKRTLHSQPTPAITITQMSFRPDWHGLELEAPWLQQLMVNFASTAKSPTRQQALRIKKWLHLSLAYDFPPNHHEPLTQLAQELIEPEAPVAWELRYYERYANRRWTCHHAWPLGHGPGPAAA